MHTQREDLVRTQQEAGHLQAKEKISGEIKPDNPLILDAPEL